jgi:sarcosine oxidase subunit alpha
MNGRFDDGGRIDRTRPLGFTFEGRRYAGFAGDTLASALLANGVRVMGRSFKLHRPRGVLTAGPGEPNALVDVLAPGGRRPNVSATELELCEGLEVVPVNCWPSLAFDVGAANSLLARFIPAGFYYKTFFWPSWGLFEPFIRRAAGFGRADAAPFPGTFEHRFAACDVLVVGGGRAGLAAATEAAAAGAQVLLVEQRPDLGGAGSDEAVARLRSAGATVLARTTAVGVFDHRSMALMQRGPDGTGRLSEVRARRVILATGCAERPLVFPGNDRPGVMLAGAARDYQERFAVRLADSAVVFANNEAAQATAIGLARRGVKTTLVDVRARLGVTAFAALADAGIETLTGAEVVATHGKPSLTGVTVRAADGGRRRLDCQLLAMSGGRGPNLQLFSQAGGVTVYDPAAACFRPGAGPDWLSVVGSAAGGEPAAVEPHWRVVAPGKAFVDFQGDVTVDDIALAAQEGFVQAEHLKRYTALGMGTDQGRTSGLNGQAILAALTDQPVAAVGTPRPRFPLAPIPLGAFAGRARGELFHPRRRTPLHDLHAELGAEMDEYGGWQRPACYPQAGEDAAAAQQREALAVRSGVGLFDASPLGKIEVAGPDAGLFLDRIYANIMSTLAVGRARYGLMLNELGVIVDDGVAARLAEEQFLVGTTAAGAERIAGWLEEWRQCEWPDLRVIVAPVTTAWGVVTVSGPKARQALAAVGTDIDLGGEAFPHMSLRCGRIAGVPARVARVSFTGERSYEVSVAAPRTEEVWRALAGDGRDDRATPVGIEAWLLLRLEKGYLHVGADTDGATSPQDVDFGHVTRRKTDFVGKRSLFRPENLRADRHQLMGLEAQDGREMPPGAHLVRRGGGGSEGYVTSAGWSPILRRPVALAMVKAGRARLGETLELAGEGAPRSVRVVERAAYDPQNERLND